MKFSMNNVYSSLYADEVKVESQGYFADSIEELRKKVAEEGPLLTLTEIYGEHAATRFAISPISSYFLFYKVKDPQEKKFRAYSSIAESNDISIGNCVIHKGTGDKLMIAGLSDYKVYITSKEWVDLDTLFDYYVFLNGSPCGVEVKDEED